MNSIALLVLFFVGVVSAANQSFSGLWGGQRDKIEMRLFEDQNIISGVFDSLHYWHLVNGVKGSNDKQLQIRLTNYILKMAHKLTYFGDFARARPITISFKIAKIPFQLDTISKGDFGAGKEDESRFPLGQVPILTLPDGRQVTQSLAIARYSGKLSGLYPSDPIDALLVDEIIDTASEVLASAPQSPDNDLKKTLREAWAAGKLQKYLRFFDRKAAAANGSFLVGGKLSLADIYVYQTIKGLRSGAYDYVPTDIDGSHTSISAFFEFLKADPVFAEFA